MHANIHFNSFCFFFYFIIILKERILYSWHSQHTHTHEHEIARICLPSFYKQSIHKIRCSFFCPIRKANTLNEKRLSSNAAISNETFVSTQYFVVHINRRLLCYCYLYIFFFVFVVCSLQFSLILMPICTKINTSYTFR